MAALRIVILIMYTAAGLLLAAISLPLIRRKVPPNSLYGFRVRRTLEDPNVWYDVNEFAGHCMLRLGLFMSLSTVVLYFVSAISPVAYALNCLAVVAAGITLCLIRSVRYMNDLPRS